MGPRLIYGNLNEIIDDMFPVKATITVLRVHSQVFSGMLNFHFEHIFAD